MTTCTAMLTHKVNLRRQPDSLTACHHVGQQLAVAARKAASTMPLVSAVSSAGRTTTSADGNGAGNWPTEDTPSRVWWAKKDSSPQTVPAVNVAFILSAG